MLQIMVREEDRGATCGSRGSPWTWPVTSSTEKALLLHRNPVGEVLEALEGRLGEDRDQVGPGEHSSEEIVLRGLCSMYRVSLATFFVTVS